MTPAEPNESDVPPRNATFATTHWSVVLAARADDPARARDALEQLCTIYWYPLYAFLRRCGNQPADAEDFVQGFIEHLLDSGFFLAVNPDKGRFRSYLLTSLNHFLADVAERAACLKRGGASQPFLWMPWRPSSGTPWNRRILARRNSSSSAGGR